MNKTLIQITEETALRLKNLKRYGDTYDTVIKDLLDLNDGVL